MASRDKLRREFPSRPAHYTHPKRKEPRMATSLFRPSRCAGAARMCALVAVCALTVAGTGCAKRPPSISVPLKYRPTSQLKMGAFAGEIPETKVYVDAVTDNRPDKEKVGENVEEKDPVAIQTGDNPT